jgi:hypothetical protein
MPAATRLLKIKWSTSGADADACMPIARGTHEGLMSSCSAIGRLGVRHFEVDPLCPLQTSKGAGLGAWLSKEAGGEGGPGV